MFAITIIKYVHNSDICLLKIYVSFKNKQYGNYMTIYYNYNYNYLTHAVGRLKLVYNFILIFKFKRLNKFPFKK